MAVVRREQITLRVPPEAVRRAEKLVPRVAADRTFAALGRITRSTVLNLALMRGLDALEQEYK